MYWLDQHLKFGVVWGGGSRYMVENNNNLIEPMNDTALVIFHIDSMCATGDTN